MNFWHCKTCFLNCFTNNNFKKLLNIKKKDYVSVLVLNILSLTFKKKLKVKLTVEVASTI